MVRAEGKLSLMTKAKLITIILAIFICGFTLPSHSAEIPKTVAYYVSVNGVFQERLRWVMNNGEEWNRFEAFTSRFANSKHTFSPIDKRAAQSTSDMIVISSQNTHLGTGRDYYLTKHGVTIAERAPQHRFFRDGKNFYSFLKKQQKTSTNFLSNEKNKTLPPQGLKIIYQISRELSNPSWLISKPQDLSIYFDFLKDNQEIEDNTKSIQNMNDLFDQNNTFLVQILSKPSEYDVVTVTSGFLRFSKPTVTYRHLIDEKNYYQFYKSRALDNIKNDLKNKKNDREKLKSQF
jgi:hypothetical protein